MNIRRTRGLGPRPVTFSVPVDITLLLRGGYRPGGSVSRRSSEKVSTTFVLQIDSFHGGWPLPSNRNSILPLWGIPSYSAVSGPCLFRNPHRRIEGTQSCTPDECHKWGQLLIRRQTYKLLIVPLRGVLLIER